MQRIWAEIFGIGGKNVKNFSSKGETAHKL